MKYVVLAILWVVWCALHSAMISVTATNYLKRRAGRSYRFYRLLFNFIAFVTLVPVILYVQSVRGPVVFRWEGLLVIVQVILVVVAILLFLTGATHYDMLQLVGIRQIRRGTSYGALTKNGTLATRGVHGIIRHPWYLATIIIIWARELDVSALITNIILTMYVIVGTVLEEHKLLLEYGDEYRRYQKRVSMLIPFRYVKAKIVRYVRPGDEEKRSF
jgi:protein-S-isoprenylcysteine O-methyltransferase Ste14